MPAPLPQILWGPNFQNVIDFGYGIDNLVMYPLPRAESVRHQAVDESIEDGWYTGTDYILEGDFRWIPESDATSPSPAATGYAQPTGVDAMLTWGRNKGQIKFIPDRTAPGNLVTCYLVDPFDTPQNVEVDGSYLRHIKIRADERDFSEAQRGLLFDYSPGMSLTSPRIITAARPQSAYYIDGTGTLVSAAAFTLRDSHYLLGLGSLLRTTLFEVGSTNSLLQSQALATAPWANNNSTATNNAGTAPDGTNTATSLIPVAGTRPTINPYSQQTLTITANEYLGGLIYVKQKGTYTGLICYLADPNSANGSWIQINLATGAVISTSAGGTGTLGGTKVTPLINGWFEIRIWGRVSTATPGATTGEILTALYPDTTFSGTATYDGVQGYYAWGAQVERFGTTLNSPSTSYMPTTTGAASRGSDGVTTPWAFQNMPMWGYLKFIDLGWSKRATFEAMASIAGPLNPQLRPIIDSAGEPYLNWITPNGPSNNERDAILTGTTFTYGQTVELFWRWFGDGSLEMNASINGGAPTSTGIVAKAGGIPFTDFRTPITFSLNINATVALQVMRIGANPTAITTLAQAALV